MLNSFSDRRLADRSRALMLAACVLAMGFLPVSAGAVDVPALYTAEVPLDDSARDPRSRAYRDALDEVLLKVSGSDLVADAERVDLLFPDPASYVVQFRPAEDEHLWVRFDGDAIESVLRRAGQTVWGNDRPATLVWIAVDWGRGERQIIGADDVLRGADARRSIDRNRQLRERIQEAADRRGIPVLFPLLDAEDLQNVGFSDIWGGFNEPVYAASERYDVNSVLIGRVSAGSSQRNRWTYSFIGEEQVWNGEPEFVVSLIADRLAAEFAIQGNAPVRVVDLRVSGVNSVGAYGELQQLMSNTRVIEQFAITEVTGDTIRYRVEVRGGAERLRRALSFGGLIEGGTFEQNIDTSYEPAQGADASLDFYLNP